MRITGCKTYRILYTTIGKNEEKLITTAHFQPGGRKNYKGSREEIRPQGGVNRLPGNKVREMDIINLEANEEAAQDYLRINAEEDEMN